MSDVARDGRRPSAEAITIDRLIDWLRQTRETEPNRPLADLIRDSFCNDGQSPLDRIGSEPLLDLACIDLISTWRNGGKLMVEDVIDQFPCLAEPANKLDLIDAEICVRREVGHQDGVDVTEYHQRFPEVQSSIDELFELNNEASEPVGGIRPLAQADHAPPLLASKDDESTIAPDRSLDISFGGNVLSSEANARSASAPIETPEWFLGDECVANSPGCWLIRGRDATSGQTLVMKVMSLSTQHARSEVDRLLDAFEALVKVRNPNWVAPSVAAVKQNHLAVVRPWVFGANWPAIKQDSDVPGRLRSLASIAYALQSAHRIGATHGGVHGNNIFLDHRGTPKLVDAGSSLQSLSRWGSDEAKRAGFGSWRSDARDLIKLVMHDDVDMPGKWSHSLRRKLDEIVSQRSEESCGAIGDELIRRSDHWTPASDGEPLSRSWRQRAADWLTGE